jgi:tetratricopeptide (TPR) repeat protein
VRQVGAVDAAGRAAAHTGRDCIPCASHELGSHWSCQANMMARETVPAAMDAAFAESGGDLADRLLAALRAAEGEGGDVRGRQSAALLVVPADGEAWQTRVELRVEDHDDPLDELARLLKLHRAYALAGEGDELMGAGRLEEAGVMYLRAAELAPESAELLFWAGLAQAQIGSFEDGVEAVRRAGAAEPGLLELLDRLSPDFAPAAEQVRRALGRA